VRILLAIDGSEPSDVAAGTLSARPWPEGTVIRVLSVVEDVYPPISEVTLNPHYQQMTQELVQEAEKLVARVADSLRRLHFAVESAVRQGDPRAEIVDDAASFGADLIVVGSHGRTGIKRWILGSVAEHVVRHAPCSVEVIRSPINPVKEAGHALVAAAV
jgi:nucleotide-binding universal stress UspA family protein